MDLSGSIQSAGGVGGLQLVIRDDGTYFPVYDANGNINAYASTSGSLVAKYDYAPFGELLAQSGDFTDIFIFRFSSKYFDVETSYYYYEYRYKNNERWLNRDPIDELGGLNIYSFVKNNPKNSYDILGLQIPGFPWDPIDFMPAPLPSAKPFFHIARKSPFFSHSWNRAWSAEEPKPSNSLRGKAFHWMPVRRT